MTPPVNPPKEIIDPNDSKPSDWVEDPLMDDPTVEKPADWDEDEPEFIANPDELSPPEGWIEDQPRLISDPSAVQPEEWSEEQGTWTPPQIPNPLCKDAIGCGEWDPPLIRNPLYRGKWIRPKVTNPAYKGAWKPRSIPNPDYWEDLHPSNFGPIYGAGFELLGNKEVGFNNIYIGSDEEALDEWNKAHFLPKKAAQDAAERKLHPPPDEHKPPRIPKHREPGEGYKEALDEAAGVFEDTLLDFWEDNKPVAIVGIAVIVLIIGLLVALCVRRRKGRGKRKAASSSKRTPRGRKSRRESDYYSDYSDEGPRRGSSGKGRARGKKRATDEAKPRVPKGGKARKPE
jgi:calnexin